MVRFAAQPENQTPAQLCEAFESVLNSATAAQTPVRVKELVAQYMNKFPEVALGIDYDRLSSEEIETRMEALNNPAVAAAAQQRLIAHTVPFINTLIAEGYLKPAPPTVIQQAVAQHFTN
jgi:hypothetical protein